MGRNLSKKEVRVVSISVSAAITLMILSSLTVHVLEVRNKSQNSVLRFKTTYSGDSFTLRFINSVMLTPVEEKYIVDEKEGIILEETVFESFGPGLPDPPADGKVRIIMEGRKKIRIVDMHRKTGILRVRVSYSHPMKLRFHNQTLILRKLGEGGDLITVRVKKYSYLTYGEEKIWRSFLQKLMSK